MLKMDFVNDLKDNYLIIKCAEQESFVYNMITENDIPSFVSSEIRYLDGEAFLYYKITGKQTLQTMWTEKEISRENFEALLEAIEVAITYAEDFFLPAAGICLLPDKMFWNYEKNCIEFIYLPEQRGEPKWNDLAEFLVDRIDYGDEELVDAIQKFYESAENEQVVLSDFFIRKDTASDLIEQIETIENIEPTIWEEDSTIEENIEENDMAPATVENERVKIMYIVGIGLWMLLFGITLCITYYAGKIFFPGVVVLVVFTIMLLGAKIYKDNKKEVIKEKRLRKKYQTEIVGDKFCYEEKEVLTDYPNYEKTICMEINDREKRKLYGMKEYRKYKIDLSSLPCTIGKGEELVTHVIPEQSISRMHVRFYEEDGTVWMQDLNSTNGTYQNGVRLRPNQKVPLEIEDEVIFGNVGFTYL